MEGDLQAIGGDEMRLGPDLCCRLNGLDTSLGILGYLVAVNVLLWLLEDCSVVWRLLNIGI